ncbi:MAG: hypothetical protein IJ323_02025 [Clostridia bacterium]|nr:hypothetical protein [Clostridia bacterium]
MANKYSKMDTLTYIFMKKTENGTVHIGKDIDFTLPEIGEAIRATGGTPPTSWSNFVLDLTRKKTTIHQRLPQEIIKYGYDLRKKTGRVPGSANINYCGTFVYRGFDKNGNTIPIQDWLEWGNPDKVLVVNNELPELVQKFISNDEASLFSVIDYCDILSKVLEQKVYRIQSPMKWQPNEIDGYYMAKDEETIYAYPVEAKAVSTADDINLVQIHGQYKVFMDKYKNSQFSLVVRPIAARMEKDGMMLAILEHNNLYDPISNKDVSMFNVIEIVKIILNPTINSWMN